MYGGSLMPFRISIFLKIEHRKKVGIRKKVRIRKNKHRKKVRISLIPTFFPCSIFRKKKSIFFGGTLQAVKSREKKSGLVYSRLFNSQWHQRATVTQIAERKQGTSV